MKLLRLTVVGLLALGGCGGGGGGGPAPDPNWYYHFRCNGDPACLSTNFAGTTQGTSNQGPGTGGQAGCNSLMNFGSINWNIPPAEQWCDNSPTIAPPAAPTVTLGVAPTAIELGQSATVTWSSTGATSCTASNAWSGAKALSGSTSVTPAGGSHTYTLSCTGAGGTTSRSATLTVNAPTVTVAVSPASITDGQSATLTWSSSRTASCTASGAWTGTTALSGNKAVAPSTGSYTYTLTCVGTGGGTVTNAATLTVAAAATRQPAPTVTISVTPGSGGAPAMLTWEATHATSCAAYGSWTGDTPLSGTMSVSPSSPGTYTYVLSCNGSGGSASGAATLVVPSSGQVICSPPSVAISVSPTTIVEGQNATLTWSAAKDPFCSSPQLNCSASGSWHNVPVAASGSLAVAPSAGSFAYTLTCSGRNGTASQSATLTVTAGSPPATTVDVTLTPPAINLGESSVLTWTSSGARSCTATGTWSGSVGLAGSLTVAPATVGAYDYVLTCLGGNGSVTDTGTLSVQPAPVSTSAARFNTPYGVAVDSADNVFVADVSNQALRKITPANLVTTFAGLAGSPGSADGTGAAARFNFPFGLAIDGADQLYVADSFNHTIRAVTPAASVTTAAGAVGTAGADDGTGALARFALPHGLDTDVAGNVYIADADSHTIRKMTPAGVVTTIAGTAGLSGSTDATGAAARFKTPKDVAVDVSGNIYVADTGNHTIRKIAANGAVTTLAGVAGSVGSNAGTGAAARFASPTGLACDSAGNIFVSDYDNSLIRKVTPAGEVTTFAGNSPGAADGTGTAASFRLPAGIGVDSADNLYVADSFNCTIRKITPSAVVTTLAGQALQCGSN